MKKIFLIMTLFILVCPFLVKAEESVSIICDKLDVMKDEVIECQIRARGLDYIVTSVSGKVKIDENLELISSVYEDSIWKILDEEFDVTNINLMSEDLQTSDDLLIATFKVKAINEKDVITKIEFEDVLIGDDKYESHEMEAQEVQISLSNITVSNPSTGLGSPLFIIGFILGISIVGSLVIKKKKFI